MMSASDGRGAEMFRTYVQNWQCDAMGHLNSRNIAGMFDDANAALLSLAAPREPGLGWADRKQTIEYLREISEGSVIAVRSAIAKRGRTSLVTTHEMVDAAADNMVATAEIVTICLDLQTRSARPLPTALAGDA